MKPVNARLRRRIGRRVQRFRQRAKVSQSVLAKRTGVSANAIHLIEAGERSPSLAMAAAICRTLRRPLHTLFTEDR